MLILLWYLFVDYWYKALYRHLPISSLKERFLPAMIALPLVEKVPTDISTPIAWTPVSSLDIKKGIALPTAAFPSHSDSTDADYDAISHPRQHPIAVRNNTRSLYCSKYLSIDDLHVDDHDLSLILQKITTPGTMENPAYTVDVFRQLNHNAKRGKDRNSNQHRTVTSLQNTIPQSLIDTVGGVLGSLGGATAGSFLVAPERTALGMIAGSLIPDSLALGASGLESTLALLAGAPLSLLTNAIPAFLLPSIGLPAVGPLVNTLTLPLRALVDLGAIAVSRLISDLLLPLRIINSVLPGVFGALPLNLAATIPAIEAAILGTASILHLLSRSIIPVDGIVIALTRILLPLLSLIPPVLADLALTPWRLSAYGVIPLGVKGIQFIRGLLHAAVSGLIALPALPLTVHAFANGVASLASTAAAFAHSAARLATLIPLIGTMIRLRIVTPWAWALPPFLLDVVTLPLRLMMDGMTWGGGAHILSDSLIIPHILVGLLLNSPSLVLLPSAIARVLGSLMVGGASLTHLVARLATALSFARGLLLNRLVAPWAMALIPLVGDVLLRLPLRLLADAVLWMGNHLLSDSLILPAIIGGALLGAPNLGLIPFNGANAAASLLSNVIAVGHILLRLLTAIPFAIALLVNPWVFPLISAGAPFILDAVTEPLRLLTTLAMWVVNNIVSDMLVIPHMVGGAFLNTPSLLLIPRAVRHALESVVVGALSLGHLIIRALTALPFFGSLIANRLFAQWILPTLGFLGDILTVPLRLGLSALMWTGNHILSDLRIPQHLLGGALLGLPAFFTLPAALRRALESGVLFALSALHLIARAFTTLPFFSGLALNRVIVPTIMAGLPFILDLYKIPMRILDFLVRWVGMHALTDALTPLHIIPAIIVGALVSLGSTVTLGLLPLLPLIGSLAFIAASAIIASIAIPAIVMTLMLVAGIIVSNIIALSILCLPLITFFELAVAPLLIPIFLLAYLWLPLLLTVASGIIGSLTLGIPAAALGIGFFAFFWLWCVANVVACCVALSFWVSGSILVFPFFIALGYWVNAVLWFAITVVFTFNMLLWGNAAIVFAAMVLSWVIGAAIFFLNPLRIVLEAFVLSAVILAAIVTPLIVLFLFLILPAAVGAALYVAIVFLGVILVFSSPQVTVALTVVLALFAGPLLLLFAPIILIFGTPLFMVHVVNMMATVSLVLSALPYFYSLAVLIAMAMGGLVLSFFILAAFLAIATVATLVKLPIIFFGAIAVIPLAALLAAMTGIARIAILVAFIIPTVIAALVVKLVIDFLIWVVVSFVPFLAVVAVWFPWIGAVSDLFIAIITVAAVFLVIIPLGLIRMVSSFFVWAGILLLNLVVSIIGSLVITIILPLITGIALTVLPMFIILSFAHVGIVLTLHVLSRILLVLPLAPVIIALTLLTSIIGLAFLALILLGSLPLGIAAGITYFVVATVVTRLLGDAAVLLGTLARHLLHRVWQVVRTLSLLFVGNRIAQAGNIIALLVRGVLGILPLASLAMGMILGILALVGLVVTGAAVFNALAYPIMRIILDRIVGDVAAVVGAMALFFLHLGHQVMRSIILFTMGRWGSRLVNMLLLLIRGSLGTVPLLTAALSALLGVWSLAGCGVAGLLAALSLVVTVGRILVDRLIGHAVALLGGVMLASLHFLHQVARTIMLLLGGRIVARMANMAALATRGALGLLPPLGLGAGAFFAIMSLLGTVVSLRVALRSLVIPTLVIAGSRLLGDVAALLGATLLHLLHRTYQLIRTFALHRGGVWLTRGVNVAVLLLRGLLGILPLIGLAAATPAWECGRVMRILESLALFIAVAVRTLFRIIIDRLLGDALAALIIAGRHTLMMVRQILRTLLLSSVGRWIARGINVFLALGRILLGVLPMMGFILGAILGGLSLLRGLGALVVATLSVVRLARKLAVDNVLGNMVIAASLVGAHVIHRLHQLLRTLAILAVSHVVGTGINGGALALRGVVGTLPLIGLTLTVFNVARALHRAILGFLSGALISMGYILVTSLIGRILSIISGLMLTAPLHIIHAVATMAIMPLLLLAGGATGLAFGALSTISGGILRLLACIAVPALLLPMNLWLAHFMKYITVPLGGVVGGLSSPISAFMIIGALVGMLLGSMGARKNPVAVSIASLVNNTPLGNIYRLSEELSRRIADAWNNSDYGREMNKWQRDMMSNWKNSSFVHILDQLSHRTNTILIQLWPMMTVGTPMGYAIAMMVIGGLLDTFGAALIGYEALLLIPIAFIVNALMWGGMGAIGSLLLNIPTIRRNVTPVVNGQREVVAEHHGITSPSAPQHRASTTVQPVSGGVTLHDRLAMVPQQLRVGSSSNKVTQTVRRTLVEV